MKIGNLVVHNNTDIGIITYIFNNGDACVLFTDGEYQVGIDDLEVISDN